jgi:hypothetical protein
MIFNKEKYRAEKQNVVSLIKQTHDWEKTEGFIADGIINPDIYANQKIKILVLLAESYGYDGHGIVDIEGQEDDDILGVGHPNRQTPKKISTLLWLIFRSIDTGVEMQWEDFPSLLETNDTNYELLQNALSRIAYVNVKKASKPISNWGNGATRLDYSEIYNSCVRNQEILKIQIDSIHPDLIIACSDAVYNGLYDLDLIGEEIELNKKYIIQVNEYGRKIIHVSHPSYLQDWSYKGIFETYQIIYRGLSA